MNKNIVSIVVISSFIIAAGIYMVWDLLTPDAAYADTKNLPSITRLDIEMDSVSASSTPSNKIDDESAAREIIQSFAAEHQIDADEYPYYLIIKMMNNPELTDFVLNYPLRNTDITSSDISIADDIAASNGDVPSFIQWDSRWGYMSYGSDIMGLTGCGPTCLSMVAVDLLGNDYMNPLWMAEYSMNNGYYDYENTSGTLWSLMTEGAADLGLTANELTNEESVVIESLEAGHPLIMIMGPGDFTSEGHFIVVTGYSDGYLTVNDPNSIEKSSQTWAIEDVLSQANCIWEYSV